MYTALGETFVEDQLVQIDEEEGDSIGGGKGGGKARQRGRQAAAAGGGGAGSKPAGAQAAEGSTSVLRKLQEMSTNLATAEEVSP
eukprot:1550121-Pyramimonas_sp.AAC.1